MASIWGQTIKVSVFGQSHSQAIGVTVDGLPAGIAIDRQALAAFLERRAPGRNRFSTGRREADQPQFICGLVEDVTCGAPLTAIIANENTRSQDYEQIKDVPRPGHADITAQLKFGGFQDVAGGGHFSGRLTAPLCVAGGICKQLLEKRGIEIIAKLSSIADVCDHDFDQLSLQAEERLIAAKEIPVLDDQCAERMLDRIEAARLAGDSVGGTISCKIHGLEAGVGAPMFDGIENRLAQALFAIPAVKGLEFGNGFAAATLRGSENNDAFHMEEGRVTTRTNRHGGILGGISSGLPITFRLAIKPTASIYMEQDSVSLSTGEEKRLQIKGRHDPCIAVRAVPVVEAVAAIVICDLLAGEGKL
ncbi:MAG: chorismate synthase [Eubacteriales bacterium]|nr:chorismate synthase [Eubacteriales bacterium]